MIKTDIKEIFVNIGDQKDVRAILPFSIASLIDQEALDESCAKETKASFCAYFSIEAMPTEAQDHVLLRFNSVCRGYEIFFNGVCLGDPESETAAGALIENRERLTYDVTDSVREGVNTVEICAHGEDILDAGVFGNIEVIRTQCAIVDNVVIRQIHEDGKVTLNLKVESYGNPKDSIRAIATLISGSGEVYYSGLTNGEANITVTSPLYWWPVGLGVQNLYRLVISVYNEMEIEDSYEVRVGLCSLGAPDDEGSSLIKVNGTDIMPMGMSYHTPKKRYIKEIEAQTEADLAAAAKAGINTVVICADSDMPGEYFFELCDLYGIVAIRESTDPAGESVALCRASKYASAGIIDTICAADELEGIKSALDAKNPVFTLIRRERAQKYPSVRSFAAYRTICDRLFRSERNVLSRSVEAAADGDVMSIISGCAERFLYASNIYDVAYISQLTEAYKAEDAVMKARINRAKNGRAVFGSLGRKGDVVGDGPIDCNRRAKAVAYRAAKFFAPIAVYGEGCGGAVDFYVSNEKRAEFEGTLVCKIIDAKNELVHIEQLDCRCDALSCEKICTRDFSEYVSGHENEYYLEYELKCGPSVVSRNVMLFVAEKRFAYEDPNIKAEIIGAERKFSITLTAEAFAQGVEIDFLGHNTVFYDNFIDITTNMPIKLTFGVIGGSTTAERLMSELRIKSVYDIGKTYI